ncbi:MAG: hypothetical protein KA222_00180 [Pseudoxanthomonas sp.]|jgi:hypothetical protein|nr:hypothetical protein [Pseudoxanthomonas sp.]HRL52879.1 hypothetical protein [Acidovorax temperans]
MKYTVTIAVALSLAALASTGASAQQQQRTQVQRTQEGNTANSYSTLSDRDRLLGQIWDLTNEEMLRAKVLLEGPRKSFSVENLSPLEALGIHARTEAERRKYAEKFVRAFRADVERSLAWNRAFTEAMQRLHPNDPVIDYSGVQATTAPVGAADALGVPRALVIEPSKRQQAQPVRAPR